MKELKDLDKKRKSKEGRGLITIENFFTHWKIATDLLDEIHKKIKSKKLILQARRQYIISIITAMEVFLKDTFIDLIDLYQFDFDEVSRKAKKFTLIEVEYMIKQNLKMGEIIAEFYNFQNLGNIEKAFSGLLKLDFFEKLKNDHSYFHDERKDQYFIVQLDNNFYPKIQKWIDLRHDLIHDINYEIKLTPLMIEEFSLNMRVFVNHINQVISHITTERIIKQAKNYEKTEG